MKRRLRRGGCVAWRHVARTVGSVTPTWAAISRADMPVGSRLRICCFFAALIGRQAVLGIPRAAVVSLASDVGATLGALDSGATSSAMRHLRKASKGSQLFGLMLPRGTFQTVHPHQGLVRVLLYFYRTRYFHKLSNYKMKFRRLIIGIIAFSC